MALCASCWRANTVDGRTQCTGCLNYSIRRAVMSQAYGCPDLDSWRMQAMPGGARLGLPGMPKAVLTPPTPLPTQCAYAPLPEVKLRPIKTKVAESKKGSTEKEKVLAFPGRLRCPRDEREVAREFGTHEVREGAGVRWEGQESDGSRVMECPGSEERSGPSTEYSASSKSLNSQSSNERSSQTSSVESWHAAPDALPPAFRLKPSTFFGTAVPSDRCAEDHAVGGEAEKGKKKAGLSKKGDVSSLLKFLMGDDLPTIEIGAGAGHSPDSDRTTEGSGGGSRTISTMDTFSTADLSPHSESSSRGSAERASSWLEPEIYH